jgi:hypothetical protein
MKHHILAIGISKHQNSFVNNLSYAAKDAVEFYNLFTSNIGDIGYQKLLTDSEATLSQIRTALGFELQQAIKPEDAFFFFYSGHGTTAENINNNSVAHFLLPFDATLDITNSCISVLYLKEIFERLPSKANFIFIDSCFSGSINSKGFTHPNKKAFKEVKTFTNTVMGKGNLIFTASKSEEEAIEDPEYRNGLFTYFLLEELQKLRKDDKLPILDIFTPITEQVTKRAKDKYNHLQTPTLNGQLEGAVYLPVFKNRIYISAQTLDIPKYPELSSVAFPIPVLQIEDKEQEKIINETINFVIKSRKAEEIKIQEIIFEKFCGKLTKKIKTEWDVIFLENGGDVSEIPNSVAKLEAASFQFLLLGGIVTIFGSERQMEIYSQHAVDILEMTKKRAGLIALIAVPEIILAEIVYITGILSIALVNMKPLNILLNTRVWDFREQDLPPKPLLLHGNIYYCDAFGGNAKTVNDHIREILESFTWLSELYPRIEGKITDLQLQVNFLLVMLSKKHESSIWADFGRFYGERIKPLIQEIKYDENFRKQVAEIFEVKEDEIRKLFIEYVKEIKQASRGSWHSINVDDLLIEDERNAMDPRERF